MSTRSTPVASLDDLRAGIHHRFARFDEELVAWSPQEVAGVLEAAEAAARGGRWAVGFVAYEAGAALDPTLPPLDPYPDLPLAWFGLADAPDESPPRAETYRIEEWVIDWSSAEHAERVEWVRDAIAAGETYQCNLTTRMRSRLTGDPYGAYLDLLAAQRGAYNAYLDLGRFAVLSASPECFLEWDGTHVHSVPMKGTSRREADPVADAAARDALRASAKDQAENVMIVDLIRNDLTKVAEPGSVETTALLATEAYPTVWQLTSTVTARTRPGTRLLDLFAAMFPCGSVTGAPKRRTMELIAELEDSPRGVYCGVIGYLAPPTSPGGAPRARFNVAIRTVLLDREDGRCSYGVGGGITWGSTPQAEYAEVLAKAAVLTQAAGRAQPGQHLGAGVDLIETFAITGGRAGHLEHHLRRLAESARHFGIRLDLDRARALVTGRAPQLGEAVARLRLTPTGDLALEPRPLTPATAAPVRLAVDDDPGHRVDPDGPDAPWLAHKTTRRDVYERARAARPEADDVVLVNAAGHVTETTIANLLVRIGGTWCTPPLRDGCLPGVGRRLALQAGDVEERSITVEELRAAEAIEVVSSTRGRRAAELVEPPVASRPVASEPAARPAPG